ncbi:MFS transporter [Oricola cellulosilytica]|uniref:MFS transporter n=1 Tax=Oricola cellulosilytica TaxID=1429082 RepID=A0A4R0PCX7_9HYPH|nr:MFS transporter [Oricola cellulosilytica]TCD14159.1 MFS transporter [Oricola cellulosilytica]
MPTLPRAVYPLLAGSALLMFAGGVNGLILPVRGSEEGFSSFALGLLGTGWAGGYILGCLVMPRTVGRVGHIRAFSAMTSLAVVSVLASLLIIDPWAWVPLRGVAGFAFAGAAMIVESWLNERSDAGSRGRVFGLYTMINLAATTLGQMALTFGDTSTYLFFVLAAIFYSLALLPSGLYASHAPNPLVGAKLDLPTLWRNSPIAVAAVVLIGVSNSAFGTLGAVYADRIDLDIGTIALFMSISILAGAGAQVPIGYFSDRMDRRIVLVAITATALVVDIFLVLVQPASVPVVLAASAVFGACIFSMYPVVVAHANDHAPDNYFLRTSGGLLLLFGIGSVAGPLLAGVIMSFAGPAGLFVTTALAHAALIVYALLRIRTRAAPTEKTEFVAAQPGRMSTLETASLDPRAEEDEIELERLDAGE